MGFFDTVLDLFTPVVYADDNQAADELQSGSGKAYGEAHETPDSKPNVDSQKGTEQTNPDLTGTPKETDDSDKPFEGKTDDADEGGDEEEASEDAGGDDEEEDEEDEPVDPMPRLLQGESALSWRGVRRGSLVALVALDVLWSC